MLTASHLVRRFGDRLAVDDVSFDVAGGEVFGLLGPNGAGKTTTLRMLAGLIAPTSGRVQIAGEVIDGTSGSRLRSRIGFLTETPGLWEQLTVLDNMTVYARLFGIAEVGPAVERALGEFDLWDRRGDKAALLSKGMKQKLALARALVHDPEVVLLDEPTANLDPQTARQVREKLLRLRERGRAIVVSTHNLDEIERLAERVALIKGRLVAIGEPAALRRQLFGARFRIRFGSGFADASSYAAVAEAAGARDVRQEPDGLTMVVDDPHAIAPAVVSSLVLAGAPIREALDDHPSLEEVYLRLLNRPPQGPPEAGS